MPRLPQPGGDQGEWGSILNDYLSAAHNTDGTLKPNTVTSQTIAPGSIALTNLTPSLQSQVTAIAGQQGATGPTGATGPQGPTGPTGTPGATGPSGAQGLPGSSGTPGAIGATGPSGAAGGTGSVGATGATGPSGASGPAGTTTWAGITGKPDLVTSPAYTQIIQMTAAEYAAAESANTLPPNTLIIQVG